MVTFLLAAVAIATFVVAWRYGRRSLIKLSFVLGLGVPAQAVIGGITVLTRLNPWVVAFHLLVSLAMIGVAVVLLRRIDEGDGPPVPLVADGTTWLVRAIFVAGWVVLYLGTVVTGSGPHAGDVDAPRNGLRAALIDGAFPLVPVLVLAAWAAVGTVLTARTFRWE
jgi:cytochrome c oxidase assembly protein subunit 15